MLAMALSQLGLLREEEDDGDLIEALLDTMHVTGQYLHSV